MTCARPRLAWLAAVCALLAPAAVQAQSEAEAEAEDANLRVVIEAATFEVYTAGLDTYAYTVIESERCVLVAEYSRSSHPRAISITSRKTYPLAEVDPATVRIDGRRLIVFEALGARPAFRVEEMREDGTPDTTTQASKGVIPLAFRLSDQTAVAKALQDLVRSCQ